MPDASLYSPLDQHRRDIRLIRIEPKRDEEGIRVALETFRLDSDTRFTALSYVWGDPVPPRWIVCNESNVSITHTLWAVLLQLRKKGYDGLLWVDAICINQKDDKEKSFQVGMMRDIYKRAANVIFWLGEQKSDDENAVRLMKTFFELHPPHSDMERLRTQTLDELGLPSYDHGWLGWASLLSRRWFERVWIVQEFLNAQQSVFMSGALEIPTELLVHCAYATGVCAAIGVVVARNNEDTRVARKLILRPLALSIDLSTRKKGGDESIRLFDLWVRSQQLEATDPRDRVFALLSTQTAVGMNMIDYSKDEATVYTEIAAIALELPVPQTKLGREPSRTLKPGPRESNWQRTSRFLACKTRSPQQSSLPSWVPDWRPAEYNFVPLTRYYTGISWFADPYDHAVIDGKTLSISGIIVDSPHIVINSTPFMDCEWPTVLRKDSKTPSDSKLWAERMLDWLLMCRKAAMSVSLHSTGNKDFEEFCRAIAFGALPGKMATPAKSYIRGFWALYSQLSDVMKEAHRRFFPVPSCNVPSDQSKIYESRFGELSAGRKFCVTKKGSLAWVPKDTKLGDCICFLAGCAVPFVIRPVGESYELLGDCYLQNELRDQSVEIRSKPSLFVFR